MRLRFWFIGSFVTLVLLLVLGLVLFQHKLGLAVIGLNNRILKGYCRNGPLLDAKSFPWTRQLRENTDLVRAEYDAYLERFRDPLLYLEQIPEVSSSIDPERRWKTILLRVFGVDTEYAAFFPKTMALIRHSPCSLAMFSVLDPHAKLLPHVGMTKGVLRYHLALQTPTKDRQKCFLVLKDDDSKEHKIVWEKGNDYVFDDMFTHWAANNTSETRVVLFLDIERQMDAVFLRWLNRFSISMLGRFEKLQDRLNLVNTQFSKARKFRLTKVLQQIFPRFLSDYEVTSEDQVFFNSLVKDVTIKLDPEEAKWYCRHTAFLRQNVHSLASRRDVQQLDVLLQAVINQDIRGDFLEAGVWRGGMCMLAQALLFYKHADLKRQVWMLDSFAAFPQDKHEDVDAINLMYKDTHVTVETVIQNFKKMQLWRDNVRIVPGYFADTLPTLTIEAIAILRLDADLYSSTKVCLESLYSKVSEGGYVIIDDYNNTRLKCKLAVDEFRAANGISEKIIDLYGASVFWRKAPS